MLLRADQEKADDIPDAGGKVADIGGGDAFGDDEAADGRPDDIVRGADIVGTPLTSFSRILATSDRAEVFNGYCGAESGNVPVSAVSPALLVSEIEVQRKPESKDMGPILPRPRVEALPQ